MHARRAARSVSAVAIAGGLTLGVGLTGPSASAMPVRGEGGLSIGQLCQQALRQGESHAGTPGAMEVLPGLRCGQVFGATERHGTSRPDEALAPQSRTGTSEDTDGSDESGDLESADGSDGTQAPHDGADSDQKSGYDSGGSRGSRYAVDDDSGEGRADYSGDESADSDEYGDHEHSDDAYGDHEHSDDAYGDHDGGSDD